LDGGLRCRLWVGAFPLNAPLVHELDVLHLCSPRSAGLRCCVSMTCVILVLEVTLFTPRKPVYPVGAGLIRKAKPVEVRRPMVRILPRDVLRGRPTTATSDVDDAHEKIAELFCNHNLAPRTRGTSVDMK